MFKTITLLALVSFLILGLAGCGSEPAPETAATPEPTAKKEEPPAVIYDLTKETITDHSDWTSRNVGVLGAKMGDKTNSVQANFGTVNNTRTLAEDYLTIYQDNGLFVYTHKLTGKLRKFEIYDTFAKQIVDEKLKKLLTGGDVAYMREILGPEEKVEENTEDPAAPATEYVYDAKGFRFVKYKIGNRTLNALRFIELKRPTT